MAIMNTGKMGKAGLHAALWPMAVTVLWACAASGGPGTPKAQTTDRQKIIVEFSVPKETGDKAGTPDEPAGAVREAATRILSRLDSEARESARVFGLLPMIALEADAATLMRLIRMPEVVSVQPDREVSIPEPPRGLIVPGAPPGDRAK